ncbi:DUF1290 domain-containing protein [Salibacterium salarium]|uniref:DUF1290 domain-containing protein n=1 Tax=Salibacterium salarium TaxID=284579 RepID=A0A428MYR2_9BACI|nr:DUF1290 domain-containing protein [Salibacterium salarium]RSL31308.1 DUF1290 domain-containing protein [Salibacterium salarium]
MWIPVMGLLAGVIIGLLTGLELPTAYNIYLVILILVMFDALLGALKASLADKFSNYLFITGVLLNLVFALSLAFLGEQLGVDLYLAPVFAFGVRLFQNIAVIRRQLLHRYQAAKKNEES